MQRSNPAKSEKAGATIYNPVTLAIYDAFVLGFSNHLAWRCPTAKLLDLYNRNLTADHLDIGPGSGWYLANAELPAGRSGITLLDLNANSLSTTARRLRARGGTDVSSHIGSILRPLPISRRVQSVAANFVMHCVPGTWREKGIAFRHIAAVMDDDGVFFGSTILGRGVAVNLLGRVISSMYNGPLRVFHNTEDDLGGLETALRAAFFEVDLTVVGAVATWEARRPKRVFAEG